VLVPVKPTSARLLVGLTAAALAAATTLSIGAADAAPAKKVRPVKAPPITVAVDFAAAQPQASMLGFLHSFSQDGPPQSRVAPLRPALFRGHGKTTDTERVRTLGARYQLVLSDLWGYPRDNWQGRGAPYADLPRWEKFVRRQAGEHRGENVIWDIWNEPDSPSYWKGTHEQFFKTYTVAAKAIRSELGPGAMIGGPSLEQWNPDYLKAFLDYCVTDPPTAPGSKPGPAPTPTPTAPTPPTAPTFPTPTFGLPGAPVRQAAAAERASAEPTAEESTAPVSRCEVNVISWHELSTSSDQIPEVADHLRAAREMFVDNPVYDAIGLSEVFINENLGQRDQFQPGELLGQLHYLEQGGADAAAHACWNESNGKANCHNDSLDGLLTPGSQDPRAVWFAAKEYSDGVPTRVASTSSSPYLVSLASREAPGPRRAQVVLGRLTQQRVRNLSRVDVAVQLGAVSDLPFLAGRTAVRVEVQRIPATGERALSGLEPVSDQRLAISNGSASLTLPRFKLHDAYVLTLSKPRRH